MQRLYAIKHIPTGHFLPEPVGRQGRGGSWTEPVDCSGDGPNPRLFISERAAKNALAQWLRGRHVAEYDYEFDDYSGRSYRYQDGTSIEPVHSRVKEEMEIVSFSLTLSV